MATNLNLRDDFAGSQIEIVLDHIQELLLRHFGSAVVEYCNGEGFGHADGVGHLHLAATAQSGLNQRLRHPPGRICCGSVHFREVLSREGAPSVCSPSAIRVHYDFATCQAGVALEMKRDQNYVSSFSRDVASYLWPSYNEQSARVDVNNGLIV